MREYQTEETHSTDEGSDSFRDWFRGYRLSNGYGPSEPMVTADVRRIGGLTGHCWIDRKRPWSQYCIARTIVFCGLFGGYIGQFIYYAVGGQ